MILQALNDYYLRKQAADPGALPPKGFQVTAIGFVIVLHPDGRPHSIKPNAETVTFHVGGKAKTKEVARQHKTPMARDRTGQHSWKTAFLLWDHPRYVLGIPKDDSPKEKELSKARLEVFMERIRAVCVGRDDCPDEIKAVSRFYSDFGVDSLKLLEHWGAVSESGQNVTFAMIGSPSLVCESPFVQQIAKEELEASGGTEMPCLVTGEVLRIGDLHMATPLRNSSQATAKFVSYNEPAFRSFGKSSGDNAPVSATAVFQYCTALNDLLTRCQMVGDTSLVFWASKPDTPAEQLFSMFAGTSSDDPDAGTRLVSSLYASVQNGAYTQEDGEERFYVLGLAPNAARLSVRFWYAAPIKEFALHIHQYFQDVEIELPSYEKRRFFSFYQLLRSIAVQGKAENIPPNIAGETLRAVVDSRLPLPAALLNMAVLRGRSDRQKSDESTRTQLHLRDAARASLIKACLTRQARLDHQPEHTLTMSLNTEDTRPAYRLGRLFAALERIQNDAMGDVNSGIRDRYYGSASASPAAIFGVLLKNANNHLGKLKPGIATNHRKLLGEVLDGLDDLPAQMPLAQQGLFAIGYYHQTQAFYASKSAVPASDTTNAITN